MTTFAPLAAVFCTLAVASVGCSGASPEAEAAGESTSKISHDYCQSWPKDGSWHHYHDDKDCLKREPGNKERTLSCPVVATNPDGFNTSAEDGAWEPNALNDIVSPDTFWVVAVIIRRVNGQPRYRYLSNGSQNIAGQWWSTTKFIGMTMAAQELRWDSGRSVGINSWAHTPVAGWGDLPLGDLITMSVTYDPNYGDVPYHNGVATYLGSIAGADSMNWAVRDWLGQGSQSLNGVWGTAPGNFQYNFRNPNSGAEFSRHHDVATGNSVSAYTVAEFMKRLAVWDDGDARLPAIQPEDVQTILYGAEDSQMYGGQMGGLSADPSLMVQQAFDMDGIEAQSHGRWRTFSKLGAGNNDLTDVHYACLPDLDDDGNPKPDQGAEFVIASDSNLGDEGTAEAYRRIIHEAILPRAH